MSRSAEVASQKLRTALALYEAGEAMMLMKLRRQYPGAPETEILERLREWLQTRPGAEQGDAVGRPVPWPPPRR